MINKKNTGAYYTPAFLAEFISKRVLAHFENRIRISVLEPSVGEGAFVEELAKAENIKINLTALDINKTELNKASDKWFSKKGIFLKSDFLKYKTVKKIAAIIGNPPYLKKNRLTKEQVKRCKTIHKKAKLSEASVKNIWTSFLVKSNQLLTKNGVLAFVLPSELLQVKFAEEIRDYLKSEFERIEIFTFNDLLFECKGQDTIVLFAFKKAKIKGEYFTNIESVKKLKESAFTLKKNRVLVNSKVKWTHHFLSSDELNFLHNLKRALKTVNYYVDSKPGIVTAANKFFIVNKETEQKYRLHKYTKPIIQKGLYVNGSVVFNESDFGQLENSQHPSRLLQLNNTDKISKKLKEYLALGIAQELPNRYKCRIRDNWYVIPNIAKKPDAFFFKRSHLYPKLLKNTSDAYVTDTAYKIEMKEGYDLNSFIYSFYNTLTLIFAEIEGRYYGGGVLELVPSEFKNLPFPYKKINHSQFENFTKRFENKIKINDILLKNSLKILKSNLEVSKEDLEKLSIIRNKLISKRIRKSYPN